MVHATASRHVDLLLSPSDDVIEEMLRREMDQLDGLRSRCAPALLRDPCGRAPPPVNGHEASLGVSLGASLSARQPRPPLLTIR